MLGRVVVVLVLAWSLVACGGGTGTVGAGGGGPAPVVLSWDGGEAELEPWSYCWTSSGGGECADGQPMPPFVLVDGADAVRLSHTAGEGVWEVDARAAGDDCARVHTVPTTAMPDGGVELAPPAAPATYDVTAFARFGRGRDVAVTFRWATDVAGPVDAPSASLALLATGDDRLTSHGVELDVRHLATTPDDVTASVTVTDAAGTSRSLDLRRRDVGAGDCRQPGALWLTAPAEQGEMVAEALGDGPYDYRVELVLDGDTHVGTARYPDDEVPDAAPATALTFDPPLPAVPGPTDGG